MTDYGNVPYDLEMVNLGSTFARAGFDYRYFGKNGFNFAAAPQPLKVDYEVLEKYQDHIKPGGLVVVVVCPFGFARYKYGTDEIPFSKKCINLGKRAAEKLLGEGWRAVCRRRQQPPAKEELTALNAVQRVNAWKAEFSLANTTTQKPTPELEETFIKTRGELTNILNLCRERQFRSVIVNMPAVEEEHRQFSDEFLELFYRGNIQKANTTYVPVLDYFRDERFNDASLYENRVDCLNDKGRRLFAEILAGDLKNLELWEE